MQEGRPVAYGSRSLTETEQNWAQIEKELFSIVYGCDKFKHYVYGQEITVETDHKPLEAIFKKPIGQTPARLPRMPMSLQPYDINLKFKPGKQIPVAATLSRRITPDLSHQDRELSKRMEAQVYTILHQLPVSESRIEEIRNETDKDLELFALKKTVKDGWSETQSQENRLCTKYWNHRDEITVTDGILFKVNRIIIPKKLRPKILDNIHEGHFGEENEILFSGLESMETSNRL